MRERQTNRKRQTDREKKTDRQKDRDRESDRQTDTERQTERVTNRQTDTLPLTTTGLPALPQPNSLLSQVRLPLVELPEPFNLPAPPDLKASREEAARTAAPGLSLSCCPQYAVFHLKSANHTRRCSDFDPFSGRETLSGGCWVSTPQVCVAATGGEHFRLAALRPWDLREDAQMWCVSLAEPAPGNRAGEVGRVLTHRRCAPQRMRWKTQLPPSVALCVTAAPDLSSGT